MARVWITDRWVKTSVPVQMPDGSTMKVKPTPDQLKHVTKVPDYFRTTRFGVGARWQVNWVDRTGRSRGESYTNKRDAERRAAELEDDVRSGRYIDPNGPKRTFRDVADEWITGRSTPKPATMRRIDLDMRTYIYPKWGDHRIGEITPKQIRAWVRQLSDGTAPHEFTREQRQRQLSPTTVQRIVKAQFGGALRYAIRNKLIIDNPLDGIEMPVSHDVQEDLPVLSYLDVEAIADAAAGDDTPQYATLVRFLAYTGLRWGEATALEPRDVDLKQRRVRVRQTWTTSRDGERKLGPPKTWEKRTVPIPAFLVAELRPLLAGAWLFTTSAGSEIVYTTFYKQQWSGALDSLGITGITIHDLRHTAASAAIAAGANVKLVQKMLGHKKATVTLDTYSHLWSDDIDQVMDAVTAHRKTALAKAA